MGLSLCSDAVDKGWTFFSDPGVGCGVEVSRLAAGPYFVYLYAPGNVSVPTGDMTLAGIPVPALTGSAAGELAGGTT